MGVLTTLECAVFAMIGEDHRDTADRLSQLIASANVTMRENTGHGFYTRFEVDRGRPPVHQGQGPVSGPNLDVQVGGEVLMMGFLLWLTDDYPSCLEGFQYCTRAGDQLDLKQEDLNALVSLGRLPPTLSLQ